MQISRRRKILLFISLFLLLVLATGYLFRYPLLLQFQYSRLRSLTCKSGKVNNCMDRIWAHRVNSIGRYHALENKFEGFETDILYMDSARSFDVVHPPATSVSDTLSLERFLEQTNPTKHFWFDTRGMAPHNMEPALAALLQLNKRYPIKQNCIFEVYFIPVAELLTQNGFTVSFNVSDGWLKRLPGNKLLQDSVSEKLAAVKYVSQDVTHLEEVKQLFPGKPIITWQLAIRSFLDTDSIQKLLDDPQVDIILVNVKSRFFR